MVKPVRSQKPGLSPLFIEQLGSCGLEDVHRYNDGTSKTHNSYVDMCILLKLALPQKEHLMYDYLLQ